MWPGTVASIEQREESKRELLAGVRSGSRNLRPTFEVGMNESLRGASQSFDSGANSLSVTKAGESVALEMTRRSGYWHPVDVRASTSRAHIEVLRIIVPPPNGPGAQLRTTAPPKVAEAPKVDARMLPDLN
jgi:hypothetical protein